MVTIGSKLSLSESSIPQLPITLFFDLYFHQTNPTLNKCARFPQKFLTILLLTLKMVHWCFPIAVQRNLNGYSETIHNTNFKYRATFFSITPKTLSLFHLFPHHTKNDISFFI